MKLSSQYMAGLFDGEGTVYIRKVSSPKYADESYFRVECSLGNCHKGVLNSLKETLGYGNVYETNQKAVKEHGWQRQYRWASSCRSVINFLQRVAPYVIIKQPYVELALAFAKTVGKGNKRDKKLQERFYKKYKRMRSKEVRTRKFFEGKAHVQTK